MLDHEHGDAQLIFDVRDPERHVVGFLDIQARRGFVQQQQLGLGAQGAGQFDHFAHTIRQARHHRVAVMLQIQEIDDFLDFFACFDFCGTGFGAEEHFAPQARLAVGVAADQKVLQHGGVLKQLDVLEGAGDAQPRNLVWCLIGQAHRALRPGVVDHARGGRVDAADQVEYRGLASAVGANQGEDLAALDVEADLVDGQHAAKAHAQVLCG